MFILGVIRRRPLACVSAGSNYNWKAARVGLRAVLATLWPRGLSCSNNPREAPHNNEIGNSYRTPSGLLLR